MNNQEETNRQILKALSEMVELHKQSKQSRDSLYDLIKLAGSRINLLMSEPKTKFQKKL
tara:strand:+ start:154 stop:330 length:177 start_codon:yes stop_codon:yes gene_type:complete